MIVLDTHVLLWVDYAGKMLGKKARAEIERCWPSGEIAVSAITFWEVAMLQERRRIELRRSASEWRSELLAAGLMEIPLDGAAAVRAAGFGTLHDDPADRFIVAAALEQRAALMTADDKLLAWHHALDRIDARK